MPQRDKATPIDEAILERLNRGILLRTGAYRTDDHIVLRSGRHTSEYVAKALVTTEPTFTEGRRSWCWWGSMKRAARS